MERFPLYIVLAVAGLPVFLLASIWIGMVWDAIATRRDVWDLTGHDRTFHLMLLVALGPLWAIVYGLVVRPELNRAEARLIVDDFRNRRAA